jgi:hypothetical protein
VCVCARAHWWLLLVDVGLGGCVRVRLAALILKYMDRTVELHSHEADRTTNHHRSTASRTGAIGYWVETKTPHSEHLTEHPQSGTYNPRDSLDDPAEEAEEARADSQGQPHLPHTPSPGGPWAKGPFHPGGSIPNLDEPPSSVMSSRTTCPMHAISARRCIESPLHPPDHSMSGSGRQKARVCA